MAFSWLGKVDCAKEKIKENCRNKKQIILTNTIYSKISLSKLL